MRYSVGQTIGRYIVEALLGEGGMGEVYRARDARLERSVALKVLRNEGEDAGEEWNHAVLRMQREAKAVAALSHANIVAIYDVGDHEGSPYIAMELVSGKPLRDLIGTDLPISTRLRIMLDVARALEAAHEANIVHRDVKPDNILVRNDGTAKVLDFGIARRTSTSTEPITVDIKPDADAAHPSQIMMTAEGALVGTPAYMAPEQLRGEPVDARADQFAWGVVAYELLAGRHPFRAEQGAVTLLSSILGDTPEPLMGVPEGIAAVVMRTLEKQPEDRWPSMGDVVQQWSAFITSEDAPRVSTGSRQRSAVVTNNSADATNPPPNHLRRRIALASAALGAIAIVGIAAGARAWRKEAPASATIGAVPIATQTAASPLVVTDLPVPMSDSPEAKIAYREGLQGIRDARWAAASAAFDRARKADPGMAAAHLRFALVSLTYGAPASREAFRKAFGLRTTLTERDQELLQAVEPFLLGVPSNYVLAAERLEALAKRRPLDTEIAFWHAHAQMKTNTHDGWVKAVELAKACTKLDPKHADCWQMQSWIAKGENRLDDAVAALDQCIAASENAIDCVQDKIGIDALRGRCSVVVDSARRLSSRDPATPAPRQMLAEALFYSGESATVVGMASQEAAQVYKQVGRNFEAIEQRAFAHIAFGDFDAALRDLDEMSKETLPPNLQKEVMLLFGRVGLREELGDWAGAAQIADEFIAKTALRPALFDGEVVDPTLGMNAVKMVAGKMTKSAYVAARTSWLAQRETKEPAHLRHQWFSAYAVPAVTKELAEEALGQFDKLILNPPSPDNVMALGLHRARGRLLVFAGRSAEALPYLEHATNICLQGEQVLFHIQNVARLGMAREASGDHAGACKSYQWVLARWGKTKQSHTAKEVAKRAKSLNCEIPAM